MHTKFGHNWQESLGTELSFATHFDTLRAAMGAARQSLPSPQTCLIRFQSTFIESIYPSVESAWQTDGQFRKHKLFKRV